MQIHYLEIVTKGVDAVCAAYAAANGVQFSEPDAGLGGARTAELLGGWLVGVRQPMHETEDPVVRPYWLVDDIDAAIAGAVEAGAEVARPPTDGYTIQRPFRAQGQAPHRFNRPYLSRIAPTRSWGRA
jgi:predicted enzyme related to lactoylglutathione lyase